MTTRNKNLRGGKRQRRRNGVTGGPCSWDGCQGTDAVHGFCLTHYSRIRHNGDFEHLLPPHARQPRCSTSGCDSPMYARGLCRACYSQDARGAEIADRRGLQVPFNAHRFMVLLALRGVTKRDVFEMLGVTHQGFDQALRRGTLRRGWAECIAEYLSVNVAWLESADPPNLLGVAGHVRDASPLQNGGG